MGLRWCGHIRFPPRLCENALMCYDWPLIWEACDGAVYLRAYGAVSEARASIGRYLSFYNSRRPHSSLAAKTPDQTYFDNLTMLMAA